LLCVEKLLLLVTHYAAGLCVHYAEIRCSRWQIDEKTWHRPGACSSTGANYRPIRHAVVIILLCSAVLCFMWTNHYPWYIARTDFIHWSSARPKLVCSLSAFSSRMPDCTPALQKRRLSASTERRISASVGRLNLAPFLCTVFQNINRAKFFFCKNFPSNFQQLL